MTWTMMRAPLMGILAGAAAACSTTPAYPIDVDHAAAPPATPRYPLVAQAAPATTPPTSAPSYSEPMSTAAPSSAPVESRSLPPPEAAPAAAPPTAAPVVQTPPPETASAPPPLQATSAARRTRARMAATGEVIRPHGMYREYVVQRHDHLWAIARDLDVDPQVLIRANHLKDADHLTPGKALRIPVEHAYVAGAGDTLAQIAERFSVSPARLADINDLPERARLHSGDQIALPAGYHDRGPIELAEARTVYAPRASYAPRSMASPAGEATPQGGILEPGGAVAPLAGEPGAGVGTAMAYGRGPTTGGYSPPPPTPRAGGSYAPPLTAAGPALSETQIATLAHNRFIWPVEGSVINGFGAKGLGVRNDGVDVRSPQGSAVHAAAAGEVVYAGDQIPGYGNLVLIQHSDGWVTAYAHLARASVQMRQHVSQGQEIGQVGMSGGVTEPQLHFEIRFKASAGETARPIDPMLVLPASPSAAG